MHFDGYAASRNMPPLEEMQLGRLTNFVYWFLTREADQEQLLKFKAQLWEPPVGTKVDDPRSPWSPENETGALKSLHAALTGETTHAGTLKGT